MSLIGDGIKRYLGIGDAVQKIEDMTNGVFSSTQERLERNMINEKIDKERLLPTKDGEDEAQLDAISDVDLVISKELGFDTGNRWDKKSLETIVKTKIIRYREIVRNPEIEDIVSDIINESVVINNNDWPIKLQIDIDSSLLKTIDNKIIEKIYNTFRSIMEKLEFNINGGEIFERWFVDGRLYIWAMKNENNEVTGYKILDPLLLRLEQEDESNTIFHYKYFQHEEIPIYGEGINNFFINAYSNGFGEASSTTNGIEIPYDDVIFIHSGIYDYLLKVYISPLEKSIKVLNQLNNLEDAMVLHQFTRAVKRRVFYINTGNLPLKKAEEYVNLIQQRHRESLGMKYNTDTGDIEMDARVRFLSMFDDYFIRADDKTRIEDIGGDDSEWEKITDKLSYLRRKLYRSMKVPFARFGTQDGQEEFKMGTEQLTRQEVKFYKYIHSQRRKFTRVFYELLEMEVISKRIVATHEWELIKKKMSFDWVEDNYFTQMKQFELLSKKIEMIGNLGELVGKYFSNDFVWKEILGLNDLEIEEVKKQIAKEIIEQKNLEKQGLDSKSDASSGMSGGSLSPEDSFSPTEPELPNFGEGTVGSDVEFGTAPEGEEITSEAPEEVPAESRKNIFTKVVTEKISNSSYFGKKGLRSARKIKEVINPRTKN